MENSVSPHFVLIDDDYISSIVSCELLRRTFPGAEIHAFHDAAAGFEYVCASLAKQPLLRLCVFTDQHMPGLNGLDLVEKLYSLFPDKKQLSIYLLSASLDKDELRRVKNHPLVISYLEKPLTKKHLEQIV